jgi:hypothetical protein
MDGHAPANPLRRSLPGADRAKPERHLGAAKPPSVTSDASLRPSLVQVTEPLAPGTTPSRNRSLTVAARKRAYYSMRCGDKTVRSVLCRSGQSISGASGRHGLFRHGTTPSRNHTIPEPHHPGTAPSRNRSLTEPHHPGTAPSRSRLGNMPMMVPSRNRSLTVAARKHAYYSMRCGDV